MSFFSSEVINIDKPTFRKSMLVFLLLTFIVFGKSIFNEYSMDDEFVVKDNELVHRGIKGIPQIFRSTYVIDKQNHSYEYRPLVKATFAIEYQFFGENPHVSHFINVLLYFLSVVLLFMVMLLLFNKYSYLFSFFVCLLFLIHPLHTEVVMSLKNRDVILSFIGCFSSLYFYVKYVDHERVIHFVLGLFFMFFALISKKDAYTFFAIIPISIWFFRDVKVKKLLFVSLLNVLPLVLFNIASSNVENKISRKMLFWENPLFLDSTLLSRIPQGIYSVFFYIKMFVIPHPLIVYYGYDQVPIVSWSHPVVVLVLLALIVLIYLILKKIKLKLPWIYGLVYFFVAISMFTNIVKPVVGIVAERFAFVPSVGLCVLAVALIFKYYKIPLQNLELKPAKIGTGAIVVMLVLVILFGGKSFSRNEAWKDSYTIYKTDVETAQASAHTHSLFAAASVGKLKANKKLSNKEKREHAQNAIDHYKLSIEIFPDYITSLNNLGMVYYTYYNKPLEAIPYLEKAIKLDTTYTEAYFNLATCYAAVKKYDLAEDYYLKVIAMYDYAFLMQKKLPIAMQVLNKIYNSGKLNTPDFKRTKRLLNKMQIEYMSYGETSVEFLNSYYSLSNMYAFNKEFPKIIELNLKAIEKNMKSDIPYINIGNVYFMQGDTLKALPYLEKAIQKNWNNRFLNSFLSDYYYGKGNQEKAMFYLNLKKKSSK